MPVLSILRAIEVLNWFFASFTMLESRCHYEGRFIGRWTGSRLFPLTKITNNHLLPIYEPMISYPIQALVDACYDRRYALSSAKILRETGCTPKVSFDEGRALTIDWYKNNPVWVRVQSGGYQRFYELNYSNRA